MVTSAAVAGPAADHAHSHFRAIAGRQIENLVGQLGAHAVYVAEVRHPVEVEAS